MHVYMHMGVFLCSCVCVFVCVLRAFMRALVLAYALSCPHSNVFALVQCASRQFAFLIADLHVSFILSLANIASKCDGAGEAEDLQAFQWL